MKCHVPLVKFLVDNGADLSAEERVDSVTVLMTHSSYVFLPDFYTYSKDVVLNLGA